MAAASKCNLFRSPNLFKIWPMVNFTPLLGTPHLILRMSLCSFQFKTKQLLLSSSSSLHPLNPEHHSLRGQEVREALNTYILYKTCVKFLRTSSKKIIPSLFALCIEPSHPQPDSLNPDFSSHPPPGCSGIL